jgi:hypothetical protein
MSLPRVVIKELNSVPATSSNFKQDSNSQEHLFSYEIRFQLEIHGFLHERIVVKLYTGARVCL